MRTLRSQARRTWRFFEASWVPPTMTATGQLKEDTKARRRASHVTHEYRASTDCRRSPSALRLASGMDTCSPVEGDLETMGASSASGANFYNMV